MKKIVILLLTAMIIVPMHCMHLGSVAKADPCVFGALEAKIGEPYINDNNSICFPITAKLTEIDDPCVLRMDTRIRSAENDETWGGGYTNKKVDQTFLNLELKYAHGYGYTFFKKHDLAGKEFILDCSFQLIQGDKVCEVAALSRRFKMAPAKIKIKEYSVIRNKDMIFFMSYLNVSEWSRIKDLRISLWMGMLGTNPETGKQERIDCSPEVYKLNEYRNPEFFRESFYIPSHWTEYKDIRVWFWMHAYCLNDEMMPYRDPAGDNVLVSP